MVSPVRNTLIALGTGIFVLIVLIAIGQVAINRWNEPFYDALARKDLQAFFHQLMVFFGIAGSLLVLNVSQTRSTRCSSSRCAKDWRAISWGNGWCRGGHFVSPMQARSASIPINACMKMHVTLRKCRAILGSISSSPPSFW